MKIERLLVLKTSLNGTTYFKSSVPKIGKMQNHTFIRHLVTDYSVFYWDFSYNNGKKKVC
jgi:hypothetical protein